MRSFGNKLNPPNPCQLEVENTISSLLDIVDTLIGYMKNNDKNCEILEECSDQISIIKRDWWG